MHRFTNVLWLVLLMAPMAATGAEASAAGENRAWLDRLFDPQTFGQQPEELSWRPGSRQLAYWWDDGAGQALWLEDAASGKRRQLLELRELGLASAGDLEAQVWSGDGERLLFSAGGGLSLLDVERGRLRPLKIDTGVSDPKFSPDGRQLAYVRDVELYRLDLESGVEQRLSDDGESGVIFNGVTDWVYWEEIWGRSSTGFWWHPAGTHIAYYHIDDSDVPVYSLVDTRPLYPEVERQRYPKAGDTLPRVEIRVVELASGRVVRLATHDLDAEPDVYLARVHWHPAGDRLMIERLNRDQTRLDLLSCEAGDGACRTVLSETWPTWVNLGDAFTFLTGGDFLWSAERGDWRHLYRHGADGEPVAQLTPEGWSLTSLDAVNEAEGWFVFTAFSTELSSSGVPGAAERHVFLGRLDGSGAERLTHEGGWNEALVASSGDWIRTWSDANTPPRHSFRTLGGDDARPLVSKPGRLDPTTLAAWELTTIAGPGGSPLPAQILKPRDFDPARRYPVLMYHYGGPGSQVVENRWRSTRKRYLWHKLMAERGYVSVAVDNQASRFFGKRGEDRVHRRFGEVELAGQLAAVDHLKRQPWVDGDRIGLWGWSGGGSNTLYSLLRKPGVWAAGVAGAPVTDWRYYDAIWMERYLDRPQDNAAGYEDSAPITYAAELRDPLLLIHGTADDNVHPQNTFNLVQRFIEAGVDFELALYPNERHSLQTFEVSGQRDFYARMTRFFDRHLQPGCEPSR